MKKLLLSLVAISLLSISTNALAAEEIIFANGDRISGEITALRGDTFEVETSFGKISVPRSGIQRINFNAPGAAQAGRQPLTPDDLISHIQHSKLSFFVDSVKLSANNFANQVRLEWAMNHPRVRDIDEFCEAVIVSSAKTGEQNLVEVSKGKKIKVRDWLDSVLRSNKAASLSGGAPSKEKEKSAGDDDNAAGSRKFKRN